MTFVTLPGTQHRVVDFELDPEGRLYRKGQG
jgi:hypothetical protein